MNAAELVRALRLLGRGEGLAVRQAEGGAAEVVGDNPPSAAELGLAIARLSAAESEDDTFAREPWESMT